MKILFRNITKYHISISVCNQPFWMNDCEWFSHDVCESVTRCVTSDGVSGCLISAGSRVPPSAGVIMTLTSCHDSPDSWLLTRDASHARCPAPTLSSLQACSPLLVSVAQSSWPLARGERGVTSSRHLAPLSRTRPPTGSWELTTIIQSGVGIGFLQQGAVQHSAVSGVSHWSCLLQSGVTQ